MMMTTMTAFPDEFHSAQNGLVAKNRTQEIYLTRNLNLGMTVLGPTLRNGFGMKMRSFNVASLGA